MGQSVAALLQTKPDLGQYGYVTTTTSNGYVTVPCTSAATEMSDPNGDGHKYMDVRWFGRLTNWSNIQCLVGRYSTSGNLSWKVEIVTGAFRFTASSNGTSQTITTGALFPVPFANGALGGVRVVRQVTGEVTMYTSTDGETWTLLNTETMVTIGILAAAAATPITINASGTGGSKAGGQVRYVRIYSTDTKVFDFDGRAITSTTQATIPMVTGHTATVQSGATLTPGVRSGLPIGVGDWHMMVERLNGFVDGTGEPFVVGNFKLGAAPAGDDPKVGANGWEDLTGRWRGSSITRGADEPFGRPRVGECTMTLANGDGYLSPTVNYSDTRPGVILRIGLVSVTDPRADGWLPIYTGLVDSWLPRQTGARPADHSYADQHVEITLVETLSALARINDNAVASQGANETFTPRVTRLLNAARWRYGIVRRSIYFATAAEALAGGGGAADRGITLQSTDMAKPRLEELYLTADSSSMTIRSDVTGASCITDLVTTQSGYADRLGDFSSNGTVPAGYNGAGRPRPNLSFRPYNDDLVSTRKRLVFDAESLVVANDPEHVVNDTRYARVGGTQQVAENKVSIGRFGRSSKPRTDLISTADLYALGVARDDCDRLSRTTFRIDGLTITATGKDPLYTLCLAALDIGHASTVTLEGDTASGTKYAVCRVRSIIHEITPLRPGALAWTSTIAFDTADLGGFPPGSILPGFSI